MRGHETEGESMREIAREGQRESEREREREGGGENESKTIFNKWSL